MALVSDNAIAYWVVVLFVGVVFESLCFREVGECFLDHRIPVGEYTEALLRTKLAAYNLFLDIALDPVEVIIHLLVAYCNLKRRRSDILFEFAQYGVVNLEIPIDRTIGQIMCDEVKEC